MCGGRKHVGESLCFTQFCREPQATLKNIVKCICEASLDTSVRGSYIKHLLNTRCMTRWEKGVLRRLKLCSANTHGY